jgi:hypothetical protein
VPHFAILMWIPLIVDRAARPLRRGRDVLVLATMVALQAAVEVVYVAPAVFFPLAVMAVVRLARRATRFAGLRLGAALLLAAIAVSPLLAAHASVRRTNPGLVRQTAWRLDRPVVHRDPLVLPWGLFGWWKRAGGPLDAPPPMAIPPLAFGLIACGVLARTLPRRRGGGGRRARAWRHAAFWTLAGVALALPAEGQVLGTRVELPYAWLRDVLPVAGVLRVPMRLGVVGLVGLCLLTGLAFAEVVARPARRRWPSGPAAHVASGTLAAVMGLALLAQPRAGVGYPPGFVAPRTPRPYPLRAAPPEAPYAATLRAGDGPLLEVERGVFLAPQWRPLSESLAMMRSTGHWRPLLNGYSSYWPEPYPRTMAAAARLPEDLAALATLRRDAGVELVLVWPRELPPARRAAWEALARAHGSHALALVATGEQGALLFRVGDTAPDA